jgi:hypothetical protein
MTNDVAPDATTALPAPPDGWFDYGYAVIWNGELALVRTDRGIHSELARWRDETQQRGIPGQRPDLAGARLRLSTFDGVSESAAIEVPAGSWPRVDRLPDGRWLVVSTPPGPPYDINARLYAADGTPVGAFAMGYYFTHVQCATDGTIWAGYFDEGVYCGPNEDGTPAISASGVARFDRDGRVLWSFNDQEGTTGLSIDDCYALTLDDSTLWCCPYSDFPIIRVDQGVVTHWRNDIAGAKALAVDGDHVLLAGGYGTQSSRLALVRLEGDAARQIGEWIFHLPDRNAARLLQGRGSILHIVGGGRWSGIAVATLRASRS